MQISQRHLTPYSRRRLQNASSAMPSLLLLKGSGAKPASAVSVFLKIAAPFVLSAALWAHIRIGYTSAAVLMIAVMFCLVAAPKIMGGRHRADTWASRVGFGERIWLNRLLLPIPQDINHTITTLYVVFWCGTLTAMAGGLTASLVLTGTGLVVACAAQFVCTRKLGELYQTMQDDVPLYRFWTAMPVNDNRMSGPGLRRSGGRR